MLFLDLETYSETPIKCGTHRYAENVEIMVTAFAFDDDPVVVLDHTLPDAEALDQSWRTTQNVIRFALKSGHPICIHNSHFDRTVMRHNGFDLKTEYIVDPMVIAMQHGLPGGLDKLCKIYKIPDEIAKSQEGKSLINLFCKPRPAKQKLRRATRLTHPEKWAEFLEYARLDIEAMRAVYKKLPRFNDERELWHLDQRINDRGVQIDMDLVRGALIEVERAKAKLHVDTEEMTAGELKSMLQRDAALQYIFETFGVPMDDLRASTIEAMLDNDNYPPELIELLRVRLKVSTTSTAKYAALERSVSKDGRLRGTLQFCGAQRTRRWAGRLFQPQNLPRPTLKPDMIEAGIEAMKVGCADLITDNVMELASSALRGTIIAAPGKKLVVADLSNIEGRVLAWLAGEQWKLDAFAAFDRGEGHDLYALAYARSFGVKPEAVMANKAAGGDWRQVGKVQELALGYEGGVGAFLTFAAAYGLDLQELATKAWPALPVAAQSAARQLHGFMTKRDQLHGLEKDVWLALDGIKQAWRLAHPATQRLWKLAEESCKIAIQYPGTDVPIGKHLKVRKDGAWLRIILPSGGSLCYAAPTIEDGKIRYMGINQYSRRFERISTYGGKLVENCTQAVARDVMAAGMLAAEPAGYEILLTVHDELITETPDSEEYSSDELARLMTQPLPWSRGLPLAAGGFEAYRYKKD